MWLLSFRGRDWVRIHDSSTQDESDQIRLIDVHPALFLIDCTRGVIDYDAKLVNVALEVIIIYSAIKISDDLLTPEQIDYLRDS